MDSEKKRRLGHWFVVVAWTAIGAAIAGVVASELDMSIRTRNFSMIAVGCALGCLSHLLPSFMRGALGALLGGAFLALATKRLCPANLNDTWILMAGVVGGVAGRTVACCSISTTIRLLCALALGSIIAWTATSMIWMTYNALMWLSMPGINIIPYGGTWAYTQLGLTAVFVPVMWFYIVGEDESKTG